MIDNQTLQRLTEQWSLSLFHRPFTHQIMFNARLQTTGGRYHLNDHHIDINPHLVEEYGMDVLQGIVVHELCHYHLHLQGLGHQHRDADFKRLLAQTGGLRYAPPRQQRVAKYVYQCQKCHRQYPKQRLIQAWRYRCRFCRGKIKLI